MWSTLWLLTSAHQKLLRAKGWSWSKCNGGKWEWCAQGQSLAKIISLKLSLSTWMRPYHQFIFTKEKKKNGQNIHQMFRLMQHTIPKVPRGGGGRDKNFLLILSKNVLGSLDLTKPWKYWAWRLFTPLILSPNLGRLLIHRIGTSPSSQSWLEKKLFIKYNHGKLYKSHILMFALMTK